MRGDNLIGRPLFEQGLGPPPHARGQRDRPRRPSWNVRSTPACAGTTHGQRWRSCDLPVHPRMRGDNSRCGHDRDGGDGPPPHARGQQEALLHSLVTARSTPACAGTTTPGPALMHFSAVHPRMRGDNHRPPTRSGKPVGPPPHARGQRSQHQHRQRHARSTPACAGTTLETRLQVRSVIFLHTLGNPFASERMIRSSPRRLRGGRSRSLWRRRYLLPMHFESPPACPRRAHRRTEHG